MNKNVTLFDFDGTLTKTDTLKFQILILLFKKPWLIFSVISNFLMFKRKEISISEFKVQIFRNLLKGRHSRSFKIEKLVFKIIYYFILRKNVVKKLDDALQNKREVIIVTASPSLFIRFLYLKYKIRVIGIEFEIDNDYYTGTIDGAIPYGESKVKLIEKVIGNLENVNITDAYADDLVDLPMIMLAKNRYLINKNGDIDEYNSKNN